VAADDYDLDVTVLTEILGGPICLPNRGSFVGFGAIYQIVTKAVRHHAYRSSNKHCRPLSVGADLQHGLLDMVYEIPFNHVVTIPQTDAKRLALDWC
jgi:hypothetical protein